MAKAYSTNDDGELDHPDFDGDLLKTTFPDVARMNFKEDKTTGEIVVELERKTGPEEVILPAMPSDTKELVLEISKRLETIDGSAVDEVDALMKDI